MKEKIGIEKLIELLNEQYGEDVTYNIQSDGGYMFHISGFAVREERLLSKKFGFIQWLVENDKIDLEKAHYKFEGTTVLKNCIREEYGRYKWLLMLLSISDTPIEFLCEILR